MESLILLPSVGKRFEHRPAPGALAALTLDAETLNRPGFPSHLLNFRKRFEHRPSPGAAFDEVRITRSEPRSIIRHYSQFKSGFFNISGQVGEG